MFKYSFKVPIIWFDLNSFCGKIMMMEIKGKKIKEFNPFDLQNATQEQLTEEVKNLIDQIKEDADTPLDLSDNVLVYSKLLYLYGEIIVRCEKAYSLIKLENKNKELVLANDLKDQWQKEHEGKAPNAKYFDAKVALEMKEDKLKEIRRAEQVDRFRNAYDATKEKMNAVKRKIDSIRYEIS